MKVKSEKRKARSSSSVLDTVADSDGYVSFTCVLLARTFA